MEALEGNLGDGETKEGKTSTKPVPLPERRKYEQSRLRVLAFKLLDQTYVVDMAVVEEIVRSTDLFSVHIASAHVEGLMKRRGRIVPVVDLRNKLGLTVSSSTVETSVIIVKLSLGLVGFIVDAVSESLWINPADFEVPSPVVVSIEHAYIQGIAHLEDRVLVMLDLEQLLLPEERLTLKTLRTVDSQDFDLSSGKRLVDPAGEAARPTGKVPEIETLLADTEARTETAPPRGEGVSPRESEPGDLRRLVTFELSGELYGVSIDVVNEISRPLPLMPLPHTPDYVLGVVNLRGTILPVIDLRRKFALPIGPQSETGENRLLFLKTAKMQAALWVDTMHELARIPRRAFKPAPQGVARIAPEYYRQVAMLDDQLLIELNAEKLLADTRG
jgi:purine-binding chemotaxis protein CheW